MARIRYRLKQRAIDGLKEIMWDFGTKNLARAIRIDVATLRNALKGHYITYKTGNAITKSMSNEKRTIPFHVVVDELVEEESKR